MSGDGLDSHTLQRRVEEQNRLIEMLTQRNHELAEKTRQKQQQQQSRSCTPRSSRDTAHIQLQQLQDQLHILQRRFNRLSGNHDELTKIKDEYKTRNRTLEAENAQLQQENTQLFSAELARRQGQLEALQGQLDTWQDKHRQNEEQLKLAEQRALALTEELSQVRRTSSETEAALRARCEETCQRQQHQSARNAQLSASCSDLQRQVSLLQDEVTESRRSADRRCAELTQLAADRGRQVKQRGAEVTNLKLDIASMQLKMAALERKGAEMKVEALKDAEVKRLSDQLHGLRSEYIAYKKHMTYQLEQERALNRKCQHFQCAFKYAEPAENTAKSDDA